MSEFGPGSLPCDVGGFGSLSGLDQVQNVDFTAVGLTGSLPDSWSSGFGSLQKLVRTFTCHCWGPQPSDLGVRLHGRVQRFWQPAEADVSRHALPHLGYIHQGYIRCQLLGQ